MKSQINQINPTKKDIYLSWFILASFFLYQYVLRSSPGVLIEEIRHEFGMNAESFALMGSMYYYGYSLMQIPIGIIVDRVGVRKTALFSISLCIIGTILLAFSHTPLLGYLSRFIVGIGSASAFMGALKLARDYLPPSKQGILIGATLTFGALGALITGKPLNYLLRQFDTWQESFIIFALCGVVIFLAAFIYLPKKSLNIHKHEQTISSITKDLLDVLTNKKIITYSIIAIGLYTPLLVMADLWGTAFLIAKFNFTREVASPILMNLYIGMAIGSILLPYIAEKKHILDKIIVTSSLILLILFSTIIYSNSLTIGSLIILLLLIGCFCGAEMLCFTAALQYTKPQNSGLTIGVVNTFNMMSGALMQQLVGSYLDYSWQDKLDAKGLRIYSLKEFVEAFSILVIIIAICVIIAFIAFVNKKFKEE